MSNKLLFKYVYEVAPIGELDGDALLTHAINDPVSESDSMLCGISKETIPSEYRRYTSYADGIPDGREICPRCMAVIKRRVGKLYGIPEWETPGSENNVEG